MVELPDNKPLSFWIFPDNLIESYDYKFLGVELDYKTTNQKKVPVFILYGKCKGANGRDDFEGELVTTIWNIQNYKELKEKLGSNTDKWDKNLFFKLRKVDEKIEFTPIIAVVK